MTDKDKSSFFTAFDGQSMRNHANQQQQHQQQQDIFPNLPFISDKEENVVKNPFFSVRKVLRRKTPTISSHDSTDIKSETSLMPNPFTSLTGGKRFEAEEVEFLDSLRSHVRRPHGEHPPRGQKGGFLPPFEAGNDFPSTPPNVAGFLEVTDSSKYMDEIKQQFFKQQQQHQQQQQHHSAKRPQQAFMKQRPQKVRFRDSALTELNDDLHDDDGNGIPLISDKDDFELLEQAFQSNGGEEAEKLGFTQLSSPFRQDFSHLMQLRGPPVQRLMTSDPQANRFIKQNHHHIIDHSRKRKQIQLRKQERPRIVRPRHRGRKRHIQFNKQRRKRKPPKIISQQVLNAFKRFKKKTLMKLPPQLRSNSRPFSKQQPRARQLAEQDSSSSTEIAWIPIRLDRKRNSADSRHHLLLSDRSDNEENIEYVLNALDDESLNDDPKLESLAQNLVSHEFMDTEKNEVIPFLPRELTSAEKLCPKSAELHLLVEAFPECASALSGCADVNSMAVLSGYGRCLVTKYSNVVEKISLPEISSSSSSSKKAEKRVRFSSDAECTRFVRVFFPDCAPLIPSCREVKTLRRKESALPVLGCLFTRYPDLMIPLISPQAS